MKAQVGRLLRGLGDVVFPPLCVHCRSLVETEPDGVGGAGEISGVEGDAVGGKFRHLCARCVDQIDFVQPPHCTTCGSPFYGDIEGERICQHCDGLHPAFRQGRTAVLFKGPARALVIELKYHRGLYVLPDIEEVFRRATHVRELVSGAVVVPVPLHPKKQRKRGYNQAILLAEALARVAGGGARVETLLRRVVDMGTQTALDRRTRMGNLKNAFALAKDAAINPDLHYVLVDDVFTTGSTLNSCARTLREAGGLNLDVVTFGHG